MSEGFDLALSHASHELPVAARSLRIPSSYAFDYEFARAQHGIGCRAATRVVVPDVIPQDRLTRLGARARKVVRYPGLKEEYYLDGFAPDAGVLDALGIDRGRRPRRRADAARGVALPPARERALRRRARAARERRLGRRGGAAPDAGAAGRDRRPGTPVPRRPDRAVDALSLVALADLVVSAGGTMNREAVALGTPVYTTFSGRLGAVDEMLLERGLLRPLGRPDELRLERRAGDAQPSTRSPDVLLDLLLRAKPS